MKKLSLILISIMLSCMLLCSCSKEAASEESTSYDVVQMESDTSIIGTWAESIFDSGYIFESDGTGEDTFWELTFTYTADGSTLVITYDSDIYGIATYEYSVDGSTLSMTRIAEDEETSTFEYQKTE